MSTLPYPRAAVSCILCLDTSHDSFLLVKRGKPPGQGKWSLPGGKLELGESTIAGALREVSEETALPESALTVHPLPITSTDAIYESPDGNIAFHYCIAQVFCWVDSSYSARVVAGDDALEASWFSLQQLEATPQEMISGNVLGVIQLAQQMQEAGLLVCAPELEHDVVDTALA